MPGTLGARAALAFALFFAAGHVRAQEPDGPGPSIVFSGDLRFRAEWLDAASFGVGGGQRSDPRGVRAYLTADTALPGPARLLLQVSASGEQGRKPVERPFDRSAIDLAQGYLELPIEMESSSARVRIGRQEVEARGNRLIAVRDAANIRRTFDVIDAVFSSGSWIATGTAGRPTRNGPGAFDDRPDPDERFAMLTVRRESGPIHPELFFIDRKRPRAVFQDAVGPESRKTLGVRASSTDSNAGFAMQAAVQWGTAGRSDIHAGALALEAHNAVRLGQRTQIGFTAGIASGDRHPGDHRLETFDVVYPDLSYFTTAPLYFPGNSWDISPFASTRVNDVGVRLGIDFVNRLSRFDAIYQPPGVPLVRGDGTGSHHGASLPYVNVDWRWGPATVFLSYVHAMPGAPIRDAGGRTVDFFLSQLEIRF